MSMRWQVNESEKQQQYIFTEYSLHPEDINYEAMKGKKGNKDTWLSVMQGLYKEAKVIMSKQYINGGIYYINKGKHKGKFCLMAQIEGNLHPYLFYGNICFYSKPYLRFILNEDGESLVYIKMLAGK